MGMFVSPLTKSQHAYFSIGRVSDASIVALQDAGDVNWNVDADKIVIGLDRKGDVMEWNERAQQLTNFAHSEIRGYSFAWHLLSRDLSVSMATILARTWTGDDVGSFRLPFFTKSGVELPLIARISRSSSEHPERMLIEARIEASNEP